MRHRISGALLGLLAPLLGGVLLTACFVEPRGTEEIFSAPQLSEDVCQPGGPGTCHDGNACTRDVCTEEWGLCLYENDDTLVPDDGQDCTVDVCEAGVARHEPAPAGTPCGAGGALTCDGKGACVGCGGDALRCGQPTSCLGWACEADVCAARPAPAGQVLPQSEQTPADCGVLQCDGHGGIDDVRADDPLPSTYDACFQVDCFTGYRSPAPAGVVCGGVCSPSESAFGSVQLTVCDGAGACVPGESVACGIGYRCFQGECRTECTSQTQGSSCVFGATCVEGRCELSTGAFGSCQKACAKQAELGCPVPPSGSTCEQDCLAITADSSPGCTDVAAKYVACLGAAAAAATTCAEQRTACPNEYEQLLACEGFPLPGVGCSPLPCVAGFDGCMCAAACDGALVADHCVPAEDGTFTCTCAKDGATVATCEGAAGCGIEKGCCQSVL